MDDAARIAQNMEKRRKAHEKLDELLDEAERLRTYGSVGVNVTMEQGIFDTIHTDQGQTHK